MTTETWEIDSYREGRVNGTRDPERVQSFIVGANWPAEERRPALQPARGGPRSGLGGQTITILMPFERIQRRVGGGA